FEAEDAIRVFHVSGVQTCALPIYFDYGTYRVTCRRSQSTGKTASGATLILFTTGLGTPTGNPICPVIKVATNNALAKRMADIIEIGRASRRAKGSRRARSIDVQKQ